MHINSLPSQSLFIFCRVLSIDHSLLAMPEMFSTASMWSKMPYSMSFLMEKLTSWW